MAEFFTSDGLGLFGVCGGWAQAGTLAANTCYEVLFPSGIIYGAFVIEFGGNTIYSLNYVVLLQVLIMESILILRVWAMSGRRRNVLYILSLFLLLSMGASAFLYD